MELRDSAGTVPVVCCSLGSNKEPTELMTSKKKLSSDQWFEVLELYGWTRRAALQGIGLTAEAYRISEYLNV